MGIGVGKLFKVGKLPVNTSLFGYYNVVRPDLEHSPAGSVDVSEMMKFLNQTWATKAMTKATLGLSIADQLSGPTADHWKTETPHQNWSFIYLGGFS